MASRKTIDQCLLMIKLDYSINITDDDFLLKGCLFEKTCTDISDKAFEAATFKIIQEGVELFNRLPSVSMFRKLAAPKLSIEDQANKEVSLIIKASNSYYSELETNNAITLKTLDDFGGLKSLRWFLDEDNPKRKDVIWLKKDLKEQWITNSNIKENNSINIEAIPRDMLKSLTQKFSI